MACWAFRRDLAFRREPPDLRRLRFNGCRDFSISRSPSQFRKRKPTMPMIKPAVNHGFSAHRTQKKTSVVASSIGSRMQPTTKPLSLGVPQLTACMAILRRRVVPKGFAAASISPASPAHLPAHLSAQATTLPSAFCMARCARVRPCATESHPRSRYPIPRTRPCLALPSIAFKLPSFAPSTAKRLELLVGAGTGHFTSVNVRPCQRFDGLPELRSPRPRSSA